MVRLNLQLFAVTTSIVDYLKNQGKDSSFSARQQLAQQYGISNYTGSAQQNSQLLKTLQSGSKATTPTTSTTGNTNTSKTTKTTQQIKLNGVDQSVTDRMNAQWQAPTAYQDAMAKVQSMLEQIQSGKTSYTDQLKGIMDKINNREEFSYDMDSDVMFQQYLSSMMASGNTAMQDTMGQAVALTGGYGSSYAQNVGNQAYNSFIKGAYDKVPEFYQMARDTYQMEEDSLYKQYGMLFDADAQEYSRLLDSYNATYSNANDIYDKAFNEYSFDVNQATQIANMQNSDYWTKKNYDQSQSQFISANDLNGDGKVDSKDHDLSYQRSQSSGGSGGSGGSGSKPSSLTNAEYDKVKDVYTKAGGGDKGYQAVDEYLSLIGKNNIDNGALISSLGGVDVPVWYQDWTISKDTYNGGFLGLPFFQGEDHNDVYTNGTTTMTYDQLKKEINNSNLSKSEKDALLKKLKNQSKK